MILEDECRKIKDHLANYPAIESSCYIPLNAAILTFLYLQHNRTLPTTHFQMFYELILLFIAREVNTRQPKRTLGTISSLNALPRDLKKQLELISILAYEGVMNNKIVFIQDELPSISPRSSRGHDSQFFISNSTNSSHTCTTGSPGHGSVAESPVGRNQQQNNLIQLYSSLNPRNACCLPYLPNGK